MLLKNEITNEIKSALRAGDKTKKAALVSVLARIQNIEKEKNVENLSDQDVIAVLTKSIKERKESAKMFTDGNRPELAEKENLEIVTLSLFLPEQLSQEDISELVKGAISHTNALSIKDMGKVMGILKPKMQGKVDMGSVGAYVRGLLT
jgi:uncharacterized protein YqeY